VASLKALLQVQVEELAS
jgi:hypothetical protein